jgi:nicotinamidase-related amidase
MTDKLAQPSRRSFLSNSGLAVAATLLAESASAQAQAGRQSDGALRPLGERFSPSDTAVVFIDPQNDVLSEHGLAYAAVRESLKQNHTIDNMERIFKAAKGGGYDVFISPHYFFPEDHGWKFNGPLESDELKEGLFGRRGRLIVEGLQGSGADWLDRFKPYIEDGKTIVASPHRIWGPQTNDLVMQLRKRRISKIILGGMLANMCVESHLREFLEQGFEVAMVSDATAGPRHPVWGDGYSAAIINFAFLAHAVMNTKETAAAMDRARN